MLCLLDSEKECNDCRECDRCDLDAGKLCDNCCSCLGEADYRGIEVTEVLTLEETPTEKSRKPKP
jgi:hypothetical protein